MRNRECGMPSGGREGTRLRNGFYTCLTHVDAHTLKNVILATATVIPGGFLNFSPGRLSLGLKFAGVTRTSSWEAKRAFPASLDYRFWPRKNRPHARLSCRPYWVPTDTLHTSRLDSPWWVHARGIRPQQDQSKTALVPLGKDAGSAPPGGPRDVYAPRSSLAKQI